jgi:hypothetical protein
VDGLDYFLNGSAVSKVRILRFLETQSQSVSLTQIAEVCGIEKRTAKKNVHELAMELETLTDQAKIVRSEKTKGYWLERSFAFSVKTIERLYNQNSLPYQFLDTVFKGQFVNSVKFSNEAYVSYGSLYRSLKRLVPLLNTFDLDIQLKREPIIHGDEKQIRYFYYLFYWDSNWAEEWPFDVISLKQAESLLDKAFGRCQEPLLYWVGVNVSRIRKGFTIARDRFFDVFVKTHPLFKQFRKDIYTLYKELTKINDRDLEDEIAFLFLAFISFSYLEKGDQRSISFIQNAFSNASADFVKYTIQWLDRFIDFFGVAISGEEYTTLYANLINIHLADSYFKGNSFFFSNDHSETEPDQLVDSFLDHLTTQVVWLDKNRKRELLDRYRFLLRNVLGFDGAVKPIKIKLYSIFGEAGKNVGLKMVQEVYPHLRFCEPGETPDLIVSDRDYVTLKKEKANGAVVCILNVNNPAKQDYLRLENCIRVILKKNEAQPTVSNVIH